MTGEVAFLLAISQRGEMYRQVAKMLQFTAMRKIIAFQHLSD